MVLLPDESTPGLCRAEINKANVFVILLQSIQLGLLLLRYSNIVHFFAVFGDPIVRLRAGFSIS